MNLTKLLGCLSVLLKLTGLLRLLKKVVTVAIFVLLCGGTLLLLLQKRGSKKALRRMVGRVIG